MTHAITILADENIANIDDYLSHHDINVIKLKGREINQAAIDAHRPHALFIRSVTPIHQGSIQDFGDVRFIGSATIGTDHVDTGYLAEHGISFANAKGCSKHSVAQYVITAILTLRPDSAHQPITLGVIGLGNIGSTLAHYAHELNWQVLGHDPFLAASAINNSSLDDVLSSSDVVSIHTPLTHAGEHPTYEMLSADNPSKLKNNALLINTARGEIINQDGLLNSIRTKKLQVVLDVFPHEPHIDQVLLDHLDIATPHIAGYTLEGKLRGTDMIYQAFCRTFNLPVIQHIEPLLPDNPYKWSDFLAGVRSHPEQILKNYYDIVKDDHDLRRVANNGVHPADFDHLRKTYNLRHEWLS